MKIYEYRCKRCGLVIREQIEEGKEPDHLWCNAKGCGGAAYPFKEGDK